MRERVGGREDVEGEVNEGQKEKKKPGLYCFLSFTVKILPMKFNFQNVHI